MNEADFVISRNILKFFKYIEIVTFLMIMILFAGAVCRSIVLFCFGLMVYVIRAAVVALILEYHKRLTT